MVSIYFDLIYRTDHLRGRLYPVPWETIEPGFNYQGVEWTAASLRIAFYQISRACMFVGLYVRGQDPELSAPCKDKKGLCLLQPRESVVSLFASDSVLQCKPYRPILSHSLNNNRLAFKFVENSLAYKSEWDLWVSILSPSALLCEGTRNLRCFLED